MIQKINNKYINQIDIILKEEFNSKYSNNNPFSNWYIYIEEDKLIGFINFDSIYEQAEIEYIFVYSEYRNKGIATKLLKKVMEQLNKERINSITLEVRSNNENAINFYKKNGFKKVSIRKNYYGNIDALLMLKSW